MRHTGGYLAKTARQGARLWHRLEWMVLPFWLGVPLTYLGVAFVLWYPAHLLFDASWELYVFPLVVAAALALILKVFYRTKVLDRSERGIVVAFHRGTDPEPRRTRARASEPSL